MLPSGKKLTIHEELGSTNAEARRLFEAGDEEPQWILTRLQTAGYGRRGRNWEQKPGDFAGSLLLPLKPGKLADSPALASFAVAVSADHALRFHGVPAESIRLKWPNDVLIRGAKTAGLLLELVERDGRRALVIGIGVNMVTAPEVEAYATTRLSDHLAEVPSPEDFLQELDGELTRQLVSLDMTGFRDVRQLWLKRAGGIGDQIRVQLPDKVLHGIFEGIDEEGALILRQGELMVSITSGEVFF